MRKLFPYLLINIVVSAATVTAVLLIWNATHRIPEMQGQAEMPLTEIQSLPTPTLPPLDEDTVEIILVVGAGDISSERVQLNSVSQSPVNLQGWELEDEDKNVFLFPSFTIFPEGAILLYSKAGVNTANELFWNQPEAVFSSGERIRLSDAAGNLRFEYRVP